MDNDALRIKLREALANAGVPEEVLVHIDQVFAQHGGGGAGTEEAPKEAPKEAPAPKPAPEPEEDDDEEEDKPAPRQRAAPQKTSTHQRRHR